MAKKNQGRISMRHIKEIIRLNNLGGQSNRATALGRIYSGHTDIIRKDGRETIFGHKVSFVTGTSGMVLSVQTVSGRELDKYDYHAKIAVYATVLR